jgi:hypothetical protein
MHWSQSVARHWWVQQLQQMTSKSTDMLGFIAKHWDLQHKLDKLHYSIC